MAALGSYDVVLPALWERLMSVKPRSSKPKVPTSVVSWFYDEE